MAVTGNKKTRIIIIITVAVLVIVLGVTAFLNIGSLKDKKALQENAVFLIKSNGKKLAEVNMDYLINVGGKDFKANLKKNGKPAVEHNYTGVAMKDLFNELKIETGNVSTIILKAIDGYTSAINLSEVMEDDNVYIAYKMDGKSLGNSENGGDGPFMVILRKDPYSQRWCKYLIEIELK